MSQNAHEEVVRQGRLALAQLNRVVGPSNLITEPSAMAAYESDWTRRFSGKAMAVVRPGSVAEVVEVVRICRSENIPIVPQGGNTGLVGGGVPRSSGDEIVLSTARLRDLSAVDEATLEVTADAGVTLSELQDHAASAGLMVGVDLASRSSATVGGLVATNAGGSLAFKFGPVRQQLVGVEAVLGSGAVVSRLTAARKDNTGYHFPSLLAGSEGTLGLITRARFRLFAAPTHHFVVLLAAKSVDDAIACVGSLRRSTDAIRAVELMLHGGMELVSSLSGSSAPFGQAYPAYVLIEAAGSTDVTDQLIEAVDASPALAVAVGEDPPTRRRLWQYRELHTEAIAVRAADMASVAHKLDVAVPLSRLGDFLEEVKAVVAGAAPSAECYVFGHLGDGNLHINLVGQLGTPDLIDRQILELTTRYGGSISAEHGIGASKAQWLGLTRSAEEIQVMRDIKRALDPAGIMNPGVLFPPS